MSDKAKFETGTYSADDILNWYDENTNPTHINSLKNSDRSVFDEVIDHEDDGVIYEIGTVDGVSVILGEKKKPEIFGQDLDTLEAAGQKSQNILQATPGFLADTLNPKNIAKGMNQGVVNAFGLVDSLTGGSVTKLDNYFTENFPNTLGKKIEYKQPEGAGGVTGSIIGQYVVPGIGLLKLLRGSVLLSEPLLIGAFSSKDEGNMASLFKDMFPDFTQNNKAANIIVNGLIANEDDSEVIGRLKNIAADSPIAFAFEGIFKIYKSLYKNKEAIEEIKSAGAAATPTEPPTLVEVVDSSGQVIKQADELVPSEKPFYSNVEKTISNFTFKKQPGNQILATLNNTAGIKQSEIQDLGLDTFLKDNPSVTKEQLDDFIADKSLTTRVKETVLEGTKDIGGDKADMNFAVGFERTRPWILSNAVDYQDAKLIVENDENLTELLNEYMLKTDPNEFGANPTTDDFIKSFLKDEFGITQTKPQSSPTKFIDQTLPGGEDYKEILITAPGTPQVYTKHHFNKDVPPGENLIAHARFNTRVIDGKKTLFIEEIQSDLHQAGRKEGYISKNNINEERQKVIQKLDDLVEEVGEFKFADDPRYAEIERQLQKIDRSLGTIPDAPFKKNWHELTMKRLIKYAVDNGFEAISLTPGKVQNARYDLSQVVNKIQVTPSLDSSKKIALYTYDKNDLLMTYNILPDQLSNYVGKELSEKILKDIEGNDLFKKFNLDEYKSSPLAYMRGRTFLDQGLSYGTTDLEIGGKGMKGFYDDMLPKFLNKFGKKYNAKLETGSIGNNDLIYKASDVEENVPYTAIGSSNNTYAIYNIIFNSDAGMNGRYELTMKKDGKVQTIDFDPNLDKMKQLLAEELEGFKVPQIDQLKKIEVPFMVITPEMKKNILTEGVPIAQVEDQQEKNTALV